MSFGFSVGDFITIARLIQGIVSSLRASSIGQYRELTLELDGLHRALQEIEHLKSHPSEEAALNGIKIAALMCQHPLDEFAEKLKKFESLETPQGKKMGKLEAMKLWGKKLRWGFCMEEEVVKLRSYLVAHVGSLNMRLMTQGLTTACISAERAREGRSSIEEKINQSHKAVSDTRNAIEGCNAIMDKSNSLLKRLSEFITRDTILQLKTLVELASKVWYSNMEIVSFMVKLQHSSPSPDSRFTWAQEPVRFEDALGRVIPVASEYNWGKIEAIILDQFSVGPGHDKVFAGEYELFNTFDSSQTISASEFEGLTPSMSITMAIVIGKYGQESLERCPRPGCKSAEFTSIEAGGRVCSLCKVWFDISRKILPKPLRPPGPPGPPGLPGLPEQKQLPWEDSLIPFRSAKRKFGETYDDNLQVQDLHKKMRTERRGFRNVRIHFTRLPKSPTVPVRPTSL